MGICEDIFEALDTWGSHPALVEVSPKVRPRLVNARELKESVVETADWLAGLGLGRRSTAILFLENSVDYVRIFLALARLGAVAIPSKLEYRQLELQEIFSNSNPAAVIAEDHHLAALGPHLDGRLVICRTGEGFRPCREGGRRHPDPELGEEIASLNYTYRGYGYPLAAMVSHAQYLQGARVLHEGLQGEPGERLLFSLPMSHIFTLVGCLMTPLLYRMTAVIARTLHPRLLFQTIAELAVDHITAVPEIYALLRRLKPYSGPLPSLKTFVSGGSPLDAESWGGLGRDFQVDVLHGYGLTEFTPVSRNIRGRAVGGTIGPLCDSVEAMIAAPDRHGSGEILIRTPFMCRGYYRRERETREAFRDGWFATGDLGHFAGDHLVFDREKKRTCKINGNIVDLEEVRRAILMDPEVAEARVGLEGAGLTARIGISARLDLKEKAGQITGALKKVIAEHKIPTRIVRA